MTHEVLAHIDKSLATAVFGERLFQGVTVAIAGAPNVGKSSLMNHLCGRQRAIVSDIPGTTRDTLEVDFEVYGIPVRLVDTAGVRNSDDAVEKEGVRRAIDAANMADVTIFVADTSQRATWKAEGRADIRVMNKCDLMDDESAIPEDRIGSPILLNALLQRILMLGTRLADPGEFTRRAVENGKMNLEQAEAGVRSKRRSPIRAKM